MKTDIWRSEVKNLLSLNLWILEKYGFFFFWEMEKYNVTLPVESPKCLILESTYCKLALFDLPAPRACSRSKISLLKYEIDGSVLCTCKLLDVNIYCCCWILFTSMLYSDCCSWCWSKTTNIFLLVSWKLFRTWIPKFCWLYAICLDIEIAVDWNGVCISLQLKEAKAQNTQEACSKC